MSLHLEIVTPEKKIFSDVVDQVTLPGEDGELGILESHTALVTSLAPGELHYTKGGQTVILAVGGGFAEVTQTKVTVLTDMAMHEDQIDSAKAEEAMKRAEEALSKIGHGDDLEEIAHLQGVIARSLVQLRLKKTHH